MVVSAGERRAAVAEKPVFEVDGRTYRWEDVLRWAETAGELAELERETRLGLASLEREAPPPDEVREAGTAFRYARGLLAADELVAWLARWGLTTDEWLHHLRRLVVRPRCLTAASDAGSAEAVWADAVCSGALERWAGELAARLAVSPGPAVDETAYAHFRERAITPEAVAREIEGRRLEWLRVEGEQLELADEDVAREVVLSVREEGESLAEVAGRARAELRPLDSYLDDVEPELGAVLLGAREGEVVGPVAVGDRFVIALARRKTEPTPDDPALCERAVDLVLRRAIAREVERRVRWHEHV